MKIIIAVVLTVMGCFIFAEHTFADVDADREVAQVREREYEEMMLEAEEDHALGLENNDSYHDLVDHNDENKHDY